MHWTHVMNNGLLKLSFVWFTRGIRGTAYPKRIAALDKKKDSHLISKRKFDIEQRMPRGSAIYC